jgi:transposase
MASRKKGLYTEEFRRSSAKLAVESGQTISQIARDLGIKVNTLHTWIDKYHKSKEPNMQQKQRNNLKIQQLERQLKIVTEERDLLKKAAAYFARESQ